MLKRSRQCEIGKRCAHCLPQSWTMGAIGISKAHAKKDGPAIRVSIAIPQLCEGADGKPVFPRFLPLRYATERFPVVIENVSDHPVQIFAEGNSWGDEILVLRSLDPTENNGGSPNREGLLQEHFPYGEAASWRKSCA